jgi:hypothetical protein
LKPGRTIVIHLVREVLFGKLSTFMAAETQLNRALDAQRSIDRCPRCRL